MLANLIDNALDAATSAQLPRAKSRRSSWFGRGSRSWFFSVRNNGPAIPEKQRAKKSSSRASPPNGRGMAWVFSLSIRRCYGAGRADHGGFPRRGHGVLRLYAAQRLKLGDSENGAVGRKYRYL
ncbi:MAG: hypothetical protein ACLS7Z_11590 [Christensenellales bacterium]